MIWLHGRLLSIYYYIFRTKEILSRERKWRTRTTILQSNGKVFTKNVMAILASVRAREEGHFAKPQVPGQPTKPGMQSTVPRQPLPGYNRSVKLAR